MDPRKILLLESGSKLPDGKLIIDSETICCIKFEKTFEYMINHDSRDKFSLCKTNCIIIYFKLSCGLNRIILCMSYDVSEVEPDLFYEIIYNAQETISQYGLVKDKNTWNAILTMVEDLLGNPIDKLSDNGIRYV